jgi:predicted DNA-binding transcriptional regulator YafY
MFTPTIGKTYDFYYTRRDGKVMKRTARVMEMKNGYVRAFCYLRMKPRTFVLDRIANAVESSTLFNQLMWSISKHSNFVPAAWKGR